MAKERTDLLLFGPPKPTIVDGLSAAFSVHKMAEMKDPDDFLDRIAPDVRAVALSATSARINSALMSRLPRLEIVSTFGVGYEHIDARWAAEHGIIVTNTPEVLNEEVADTAIGLLLCTAYQLPRAEHFLRSDGRTKGGNAPQDITLRHRTIGMVGMGRIGQAIARRLDAMRISLVYHARHAAANLPYRYYAKLIDMAHDVDVLLVIVPGGPGTQNLINADVIEALGPNGILINMSRGSVVDESALIRALKERKIFSAGLDVFSKEPEVPQELIDMDQVVLFPHLGSASELTRQKMDQLVVDNLLAWNAGKPPLTPVPETPWPQKIQR